MGSARTFANINEERDSLGRRSRFKRVRTGKRLVLGHRDIQILRWLHRYRYLRQSHLLEIFKPGSRKRFIERLGDLFHETGLINRPELADASFLMRSEPMLYELTPEGVRYLAAINQLPNRAVNFSLRSPRSYRPNWLHTMMIVETLLGIELQTAAIPEQRFVPVDEILLKAPQSTRIAPNPLAISVTIEPGNGHVKVQRPRTIHIIPDALYGTEYEIDGENRYRFWALECERTTPESRSTINSTSFALKRAAYAALIKSRVYQGHWGIPNLKLNLVHRSRSIPVDGEKSAGSV